MNRTGVGHGPAALAWPRPGSAIRPVTARRGLLLALYAAIIVLGAGLGQQLVEACAPYFQAWRGAVLDWMILAAVGIYAVVMAVPFVPAAEIGLALLILWGPHVALHVYLGTVAALVLAYLVGRAVPPDLCVRAFGYFGLRRAGDLARRLGGLDASARLELLLARAPRRFTPALLRHRYLTLALALNLPGNTLLGGGGGIALCAGLSGLYPLPCFIATVAIAVAPVPIAFAVFT